MSERVKVLYSGADPGKSPALCCLDENGSIIFNTLVKAKEDFPYAEWRQLCYSLIAKQRNEGYGTIFSVCEKPHSVYGASAKSNFIFGLSVGCTIQGLYEVIPQDLVAPKAWQKVIWKTEDRVKGDTKATSLNAAKRILGSEYNDELFLPTKRSTVPNHNLVDSYLIARYCYEKNKDNGV